MQDTPITYSDISTPPDPELEGEIAAAIDPWLAHMTWRRDFDGWRERRIWQEQYQEANLKDARQALGMSLGAPVAQISDKMAGKSILDLGAGMGGMSVAMMREFGPQGARLQAMDYNPDYCRIASLRAQRYGLELPIVVAAGEMLPYPDLSFDLIVCLDVLEHVADAETVLMEIYRALKPGGVVLTTVPNRRAFRDPHYHLPFINWLPRRVADRVIERSGHSKSEGILQDRQEHSDLNTYTWGAFAKMASDLGFGVRDQVYRRIRQGEVRQLTGARRKALNGIVKLGLFGPLYRAYRYAWQGTYQIRLLKPR